MSIKNNIEIRSVAKIIVSLAEAEGREFGQRFWKRNFANIFLNLQ